MPKLDRFRLESARRLRSSMTDEERKLWHHLWRIPVEGTHSRRQASLGPYYPDFVSHRLKLVIEIDGAQHGFEHQRRHDEKRTRWLEGQGYRVIRFWTHEVKRELDAVLDTIYAAVAERSSHRSVTGKERREAADSHKSPISGHPTPALTRRPSPSRGG